MAGDGAHSASPRLASSAARAPTTILGRPRGQPGGQLAQALVERHGRLEPERLARAAHVGEAVADVARAVVTRDRRLDVSSPQRARDELGHVADRHGRAAADVEDLAGHAGPLEREQEGARDVMHAHEVAPLQAVLVDERGAVVEQARREDRHDPRMGIRERLARTVDVAEPQRDRLDPVRLPEREAEALLIELRQRVRGGRLDRLRLGRRPGAQRAAARTLDPSPRRARGAARACA